MKEFPAPAVVGIVVALLALVGFLIFRGSSSVQGDGKQGNVQAAPPMPAAARQSMQQQYQPRSATRP